MLCAYAKLPKSSSRQRWHRHVRASSRCLASTTRESADQKQKWVYRLLCRALRRCSKHHHAYVITVAVTTRRSGFYGHSKKKLLQQVISDPEARELVERAGESLELWNKVKADMKTFVLSKVYNVYMRTHVLLMGRPRFQDGKKHWRKEHSPPPLWWLHTESKKTKQLRNHPSLSTVTEVHYYLRSFS